MILLILLYLVCVFVCYGIYFADQRAVTRFYEVESAFSVRSDAGAAIALSIISAILGPLGILLAFCLCKLGENGFKLWEEETK